MSASPLDSGVQLTKEISPRLGGKCLVPNAVSLEERCRGGRGPGLSPVCSLPSRGPWTTIFTSQTSGFSSMK